MTDSDHPPGQDNTADSPHPDPAPDTTADRRTFLSSATTLAMGGGIVASYGTFAGFAGRYVLPAKIDPGQWVFVAPASEIPPGQSFEFKTPDGSSMTIVRASHPPEPQVGNDAEPSADDQNLITDFIGLSSVCPHLGCRVHWEAQNNRFFCPCHNGAFDPVGKAIAGPPFKAGQSLPRYDLKIDSGLLFVRVKTNGLNGNG